MTGPPTPPPSSAIEIQDAARTRVVEGSTEPPVQPEPAQAPAIVVAADKTPYEQVFLEMASARSTLRCLIELAEHRDMTGRDQTNRTRLIVVAPLVLAYMIQGEITPARYALARLPKVLKSLPITQSLLALLASVSERKYTQIYTRAGALYSMVLEKDFPDAQFGQFLAGMIEQFVDAFRVRTFALLARAYTSIPVPLAQTYLGYSSEKMVHTAVSHNWSFNESTHTLTPPKQTISSGRRAVQSVPSSLTALNIVADSVAKLEA